MTPNEIILALVDVASAAFAVQHGTGDNNLTDREDMDRLRAKLFVLDQLPQPANMPPLAPSAKARYYMQAFLGGAPVEIDGKQFSAAFWLSGLGEEIPQIQPQPRANDGWVLAKETVVEMPDGKKELGYTTISGLPVFTDQQDAHKSHGELKLPLGWVVMRVQQLIPGYVMPEIEQPAVRGFGDPSAAEINDITMDTLGKWPSFEAQSWACKVVRAVAEKLREKDSCIVNAVRPTSDEALVMEALDFGQFSKDMLGRGGAGMGLVEPVRLALVRMLEKRYAELYGGVEPKSPTGDSHIDPTPAHRTVPVIPAMKPAAPSREYLAREAMNKLLLELATTYSNRTAKRIILDVGGVHKMKDIPDDKVNAVTIAARDRLALERRIAELRAAGDEEGAASLIRGTERKTAASPETAARQHAIQDSLQRIVGDTREAYGMPILPQYWPSPIQDPMNLAGMDTSGTREVELPKDDQVQGQGGEFDGGGASGDFQ